MMGEWRPGELALAVLPVAVIALEAYAFAIGAASLRSPAIVLLCLTIMSQAFNLRLTRLKCERRGKL